MKEMKVRSASLRFISGEPLEPRGHAMKTPLCSVSLACASTIFFFFWVAPFTGLTAATFILSGISLFGLLLFIPAAREETRPRYFDLLLPGTVFALGVVSFLVYPDGNSFFSDPVSGIEVVWIGLLAALSPASLAFVHLLPERLKAKALVPLRAIAGIVLFAAIIFACVVKDTVLSPSPTLHPWSGLITLYWAVGLPLIGFNLLAIAIRCRGDD